MMRLARTGAVICGALMALVVLHAAPAALATEGGAATAQKILAAANEHYKAGRYAKATGMYLTAHELSGSPSYLYNAGRSEQRAFRLDTAEKYYRAYLAAEKANPGGIAKAQLHLKEISEARAALKLEGDKHKAATAVARADAAKKKAVAARKAPAPMTSAKPGSALTDGTGLRSVIGIGLLVVGVGTAGTGAWMLSNASGEQADLDKQIEGRARGDGLVDMPYADYKTEQNKINDRVVRGGTTLGVGAVVAVVGAWLVWANPTATSVAFDPRPGQLNLQVTVGF